MTNSAAPGGVSSSYRGGAAHCGCGRNRTTSVYDSPDALRQGLTVAIAPDWLYLQADHRVLMCVLWGPKKLRAWHPGCYTALMRALRYPPADNFSSRQEDRMKMPWQVCRATVGQHDGERRWDYAYQFLLQWAMEHAAGSSPVPSPPQEESHGSRSLRPGFNDSSTTAPDD
jgi:hypothetical protein